MVTDLQNFRTLYVADTSSYVYFHVHIKHSYKTTLQVRQSRMAEPVNDLQRGYKTTLQCEENRIRESLERIEERYALTKQNSSCFVRDNITAMIDDLSQAVKVSAEAMSGTSLANNLKNLFGEITIQRSMALVHEIAEEEKTNDFDSKVPLSFVKLGYLLGGYIPTPTYVNLEKGYIRDPKEYIKILQQIFATDIFE